MATKAELEYIVRVQDQALRGLQKTLTNSERQLRQMSRAQAEQGRIAGTSATHQRRHNAEVTRAERGALAASGAFHKMGRAMVFASGAFIGGAIVGAGLRGIVDASKAAQAQTALLQQTARTSGVDWQKYGATIQGVVKQQSQFSGYEMPQTTRAFASFLRYTKDSRAAARDLSVAINVARGRNISLEQSTTLVMRAQIGMVGTLRRLGIQIPAYTKAEDALHNAHAKVSAEVRRQAKEYDRLMTGQKAVQMLGAAYSGQAAKYAQTAAGQAARFRVTATELEVGLGKALLPTLGTVLRALTKWLEQLNKSGAAQHYAAVAVHAVSQGYHILAPIIVQVAQTLGGLIKMVGGTRNAFVILLGVLAAKKLIEYASALRRVATALQVEAGVAKATAAANVDAAAVSKGAWIVAARTIKAAFMTTILGAAIVAALWVATHWDQARKVIVRAAAGIGNAFITAFEFVVKLASKTAGYVLEFMTLTIRGILKLASKLPFVGGYAADALRRIDSMISTLKNYTPQFGRIGQSWGQSLGEGFGREYIYVANRYIAQALMGAEVAVATIASMLTGGKGVRIAQVRIKAPAPVSTLPALPPLAGVGGAPTTPVGGGGTKGRKGAKPSNAAGVAVARAAESQIGVPYVWGGTKWNVGLDCSGLAQGALRQIGINIPRTSQEQFAQAKVHPAVSELLPGDLVFYGEPHPGHVAVYIGGGRVVHAPHTGSRVQIASVNMMTITGTARYWAPGMVTPHGMGSGRPKPAAQWKVSQQRAALAALGREAVGAFRVLDPNDPGWSQMAKLPPAASRSLRAMIAAIKRLWRSATKDGIITSAELARITDATRKAMKYYSSAVQKEANRLRRAHEAALAKLNVARGMFASAFDRLKADALTAFDAATQRMLDNLSVTVSTAYGSFQYKEGDETPAQRQLRMLQESRTTKDQADAIAEARKKLTEAESVGDPEAIAAARKDLDNALLDQQETALQKRADAEQTAADKALEAARKDVQARRDLERRHFEDSLDALEKYLEKYGGKVKGANDKILGLLAQYGVSFGQAGLDLGAAFATGLGETLDSLDKYVVTIRAQRIKTGQPPGPVPTPVGPAPGHRHVGGTTDQSDVAGAERRVVAGAGSQIAGGDIYHIAVTVEGSVQTENDIVDSIRAGIAKKTGRNPRVSGVGGTTSQGSGSVAGGGGGGSGWGGH